LTENPGSAEEDSAVNGLLLLIDPTWVRTEEAPEPPVGSVLGAWPVTAAGGRGRFQANPIYQPATADSPLDPVDAVLRLLARNATGADELRSVLRDVMLAVALDDRGVALVQPAPDGVPSVLVTTAPGHRKRLDVPGWQDMTVEQLAAALPAQGVDVLLNPGAPASMRVLAAVIRSTADGTDEEQTWAE